MNLQPQSQSFAPYLSMADAAAYVGCKSVRAFYEWRKRHGVTRLGDGTIPRLELDRIKKRQPRRRQVNPISLRNLQRRHPQDQ